MKSILTIISNQKEALDLLKQSRDKLESYLEEYSSRLDNKYDEELDSYIQEVYDIFWTINDCVKDLNIIDEKFKKKNGEIYVANSDGKFNQTKE